jgi:hypothetical protein
MMMMMTNAVEPEVALLKFCRYCDL